MGIFDWILGQKDEIQKGISQVYSVVEIDLSKAHTNKKYDYWGDQIIVTEIDSEAHIRLNRCENDLIDLSIVRQIKTPYKNFYITNSALSGKLKILVGSGGIFDTILADPNISVDSFGHIHTINLDELAVRLGSINTYDRRGTVIWMDDFEGTTLKWELQPGGGGGSASLDTLYCLNGSQSCKIQSGTTNGSPSIIHYYVAYPTLGKIGFEIAFTYHARIDTVVWLMELWDGTTRWYSKIEWDATAKELYYYNHNYTKTLLVGNRELGAKSNSFGRLKLVVDFANGKYVRLLHNEMEYDMSDFVLKSGSSLSTPILRVSIGVDGDAGQNAIIYVDDCIVTLNEP